MPRVMGALPPKPFERVMAFIDGGYVRELCKKQYGHDHIDFKEFRNMLVRNYNANMLFQANLIRIYYYDAIVESREPKHKEQRDYFDAIANEQSYTVRLGSLVKSAGELANEGKKFKQKGVDILMSIDAVSKAYLNHYDTGIFVMGDGDFVPLIEAVKDTGKKTVCISNPPTASVELLRCFDMRIYFEYKDIEKWLEK
jgi:uncharacterized LabA/DUF88 family protein